MCRRSQDRRSYLQLFTLQDKDALRRFEKLRSKLQFLLRFKPVAIRESLASENTQVTISPCSAMVQGWYWILSLHCYIKIPYQKWSKFDHILILWGWHVRRCEIPSEINCISNSEICLHTFLCTVWTPTYPFYCLLSSTWDPVKSHSEGGADFMTGFYFIVSACSFAPYIFELPMYARVPC